MYYSSVDLRWYSISGSAYSLYPEVFITIWRPADSVAGKVKLELKILGGMFFVRQSSEAWKKLCHSIIQN